MLYEALAGVNPVRAGSPAATARRVGTVLPPLRRARKDLPEELCAAIDTALRPKPDERGTLDELAAELAESLPEVSDEGGTVAPHPLERTEPFGRCRAASPAAAPPLLAGGLAAAALQWLGQPVAARARPPSPRSRCSRGSAGSPPRSRSSRCSRPSEPGAAVLVAAAVAARPARCCAAAARAWSVPALAPLLGPGDTGRRVSRARRPGARRR